MEWQLPLNNILLLLSWLFQILCNSALKSTMFLNEVSENKDYDCAPTIKSIYFDQQYRLPLRKEVQNNEKV